MLTRELQRWGSAGLMVLASGGAAYASAACDAVNAGGFDNETSSIGTKTQPQTGFEPGETLNFVVTKAGLSSVWRLLNSSADVLVSSGFSTGTSTHTYIVASDLDSALRSQIRSTGDFIGVTATCVPVVLDAVGSTIEDVQAAGSARMARTSAQITSSVIGRVIGQSFANLESTGSLGPSGVTLSYVPTRTALGSDPFADLTPEAREADWSVWADLQGSGTYSLQGAEDATQGGQANFSTGVTYKLSPDMLVGAFVGAERGVYSVNDDALRSTGATLGGYGAWRILPELRWDVLAAYTGLFYDIATETATGEFSGNRAIVATALTGSIPVGTIELEPSVSLLVVREWQPGWEDSEGEAHDGREVSAETVALGGRLVSPEALNGMGVTVYAGAYGIWDHARDGRADGASTAAWSARLTSGVSMSLGEGGQIALDGQYDGLGSDTHTWSARAALSQAF
ncbi:autotransporter outer membrane beta-barrel domain-containing protein [Pelagibacterium montanilacus]|uniref:autotransporter outer membrane beta-barrel domain-containing protein n=1 Tax=Pelagibacterium montanilacus TaxID=2185280 RepID=UPI001FE469BA|nr:autotransporter outer membrane beta-barrel domain-containing protein [Pelagibacterium montanilacus]